MCLLVVRANKALLLLLLSTSLDLRAAKLLKTSLKIVVVGDKTKRQILSKLAEIR